VNDRGGYVRPGHAAADRQVSRRTLVSVLVVAVLCGGVIAYAQRDSNHTVSNATAPGAAPTVGSAVGPDNSTSAIGVGPTTTIAPTASVVAAAGAAIDSQGDAVGAEPTSATDCVVVATKVRLGDTGADVNCVQSGLMKAGYYVGPISGTYDSSTEQAVRKLQTDKNMFVDGVVGRETGLFLKVWPAETLHVVHTPPPPAGAVDLLGYKLSDVSVSGPQAPPLPPNSGNGKRLVYDRDQQRVWAVSADEVVIRSWLVSGSQYPNEHPGVHKVFSRSPVSTAWNGKAYLNKMVRYDRTPIGAIGFHALPIHVADGTAYQTDAQLGQRLSGGCTRQANLDAAFTWDFAQVGTTVIVI